MNPLSSFIERTFTYDDPDFAARLRVLSDYTVRIWYPTTSRNTQRGEESNGTRDSDETEAISEEAA